MTDGMKQGRKRIAGEPLLAGDVAKALGIGVQTLHYYEREGLIGRAPRSAAGYRLYSDAVLERVRFIRKAQALGLPLDEVKEVLRLSDHGGCPCGHVQEALTAKLVEVDARLRELRNFRRDLAALVARSATLRSKNDGATVCAIVEHSNTERATPPTGSFARLWRGSMANPTTLSGRRCFCGSSLPSGPMNFPRAR